MDLTMGQVSIVKISAPLKKQTWQKNMIQPPIANRSSHCLAQKPQNKDLFSFLRKELY